MLIWAHCIEMREKSGVHMVVRLCVEMHEKWWLDCALKCMKKSGVHMVVRLSIEMHSLLCGMEVGYVFGGGHVDSQYKITYKVYISVLPGTTSCNLLFCQQHSLQKDEAMHGGCQKSSETQWLSPEPSNTTIFTDTPKIYCQTQQYSLPLPKYARFAHVAGV